LAGSINTEVSQKQIKKGAIQMGNQIGVVGIGNMGMGIAGNLLTAGFDVMVYDIRPEPLVALREKGATVAPDIPALAKSCRTVFSVLLNYDQNLSVLSGPDGLAEKMTEGGSIFVCSTISPEQARALAQIAVSCGVRLLDAPISGGAEGAMAGTLSVMIGGDAEAVNENRKALEAIGSNIYHFGDVGTGESAKAINQLLVSVNNVAVAEAMLLAARSGLDLKQVHDLITNSAGNSWIFQHRAMRMIERDFVPRGVLRILLKDAGIVADAAASMGLVLPVITLARQLYQAGVNNGWGDEDDSAVVKVLEQLARCSVA